MGKGTFGTRCRSFIPVGGGAGYHRFHPAWGDPSPGGHPHRGGACRQAGGIEHRPGPPGRNPTKRLAHRLSGASGLLSSLPGLQHLEVRLAYRGMDYALYSEFESRQALETYAEHPLHIEAKGKF
ncbi:MAG: Dabb family protein, partial [Clostridia bacterium]|nr:Dabb family protein [Clostridia bacterium]